MRLKTNRTIKIASKICMTTIIAVSPLKATILNNKIKLFWKNVFFCVTLWTFQPNCYLNLVLFSIFLQYNTSYISDYGEINFFGGNILRLYSSNRHFLFFFFIYFLFYFILFFFTLEHYYSEKLILGRYVLIRVIFKGKKYILSNVRFAWKIWNLQGFTYLSDNFFTIKIIRLYM